MPINRAGLPMIQLREIVRPLFRGLAIPASGLSAQRQRIDVITSNIANAETTRTPEGGPYRRRVVELQPRQSDPQGEFLGMGVMPVEGMPTPPRPVLPTPGHLLGSPEALGGVEVTDIVEDETEGPLVYDPGHPDADETGYVQYPNVNITDEMVHLLEARRLYEANATVFEAVKSILRRSIEI